MKRKVIIFDCTQKRATSIIIQFKLNTIKSSFKENICQLISAINTELRNTFNNKISENKSTLLILTIQT